MQRGRHGESLTPNLERGGLMHRLKPSLLNQDLFELIQSLNSELTRTGSACKLSQPWRDILSVNGFIV